MNEEVKKPLYKRWWFIGIIAIVFLGIIGSFMEDEEVETANEDIAEVTETNDEEGSEEPAEEEEVVAEDETEEESVESEPSDESPPSDEEQLQSIVEDYLPEINSEANKIDVNYNFGRDDGTYLVLPHLVWNVPNSAGTTREMLEMYSARLANEFSGLDNVSDITIFWEVPYHAEGTNVAKFEFVSNDGEIEYVSHWYDEILRD